jgi:hypothetical protein
MTAIQIVRKDHKVVVREMTTRVKALYANTVDLQESLVQGYLHARDHGDVSLLKTFVDLLSPTGQKAHPYVTGITTWIRTFTPVMVKANGNWGLRKEGSENYKPFDDTGIEIHFLSLQAAGSNKLIGIAEVLAMTKAPLRSFKKAVEEGRVQMSADDVARTMSALQAMSDLYPKMMGMASDAAPTKAPTLGNVTPLAAAPAKAKAAA